MQNAVPPQKRHNAKFRIYRIPRISIEKQVFSYITKQRLSDSLELLQALGYRGDDAIRRIQYLQWEELC